MIDYTKDWDASYLAQACANRYLMRRLNDRGIDAMDYVENQTWIFAKSHPTATQAQIDTFVIVLMDELKKWGYIPK